MEYARLEIGDRVLIRNVGLKGRNKLADKWQDVAYVVKGQSNPDIPVFTVSPEGGGKGKVLHRNMLLPISPEHYQFTTGDIVYVFTYQAISC